MSRTYIFEQETIIGNPLNEVFQFFSNAENLAKITPDNLKFQIKSPLPIKMEAGTLIDYQIKIYNIPFHWRTKITVWDPPVRFVDVQLTGPYKMWIHEHSFEELGGSTKMSDKIQYQVPGGLFAPLVHRLRVKKDVENIFKFREKIIKQIFSK
jgi:ligand-binding SRPBCC domain-containing protein